MTTDDLEPSAPTGGAATNRGVWYQALWIALQAASDLVSANAGGGRLRFILEPDGGDVRVESTGRRRVVQLKTRHRGTWSLKQVVDEVLPDLFRAVDPADADATYEFVTGGRMGDWARALTFLNGLGTRDVGGEIGAGGTPLDDRDALRFGGAGGDFWSARGATERGVFERIVERLRGPAPADGGPDARRPIEAVRRDARHLLSRFRFSGGHTPEGVKRELERVILKVAGDREDVPALLSGMVGRLVERGGRNGEAVSAAELFDAVGLSGAVPVGDLVALRRRCREAVSDRLGNLGYRVEWDVRRPAPRPDAAPFLAVGGGSGEGKSWAVYAEADAAETPAVVLIDSCGDAARDLDRAAAAVWQEALGHPTLKSLGKVAGHLDHVLGPARGTPWLTLCVDRVADPAVARSLLAEPVERWGVRVVLGCEPGVAAVLSGEAGREDGRVDPRAVGPFTPTELHEYLRRRLGDGPATGVPPNVLELLRKPQLAAIYCELADTAQGTGGAVGDWRPHDEYALVRKFWSRVNPPHNAGHPKDELRLRRLAADALDGEAYPWPVDRLDAAGLDDAAIDRLVRLGWLRPADNGIYEVPHDRLLGHAAARALVARCREDRLDAAAAAGALVAARESPNARRLGYLLMDWLDLALADPALSALATAALADYAGRLDHHARGALHAELLPTLGAQGVAPLISALTRLAASDSWWELGSVLDGLAACPAESLREPTVVLLGDARLRVARAGLLLLGRCPIPDALDAAWQQHRAMQADPLPYAGDDLTAEHAAALLYHESMDALRAAVRLAPNWLDRAIRDAEMTVEPVADLAYLTASLDNGGAVWRARKADLFAKVPSDKRRSLAVNIGTWRDAGEADRLEAWASEGVGRERDRDSLASASVRAMTRIDPIRAVGLLRHIPNRDLYLARHWFLPRLFLLAGDATRVALRERIAGAADPLECAMLYQGNENEMDVATLELLLDELSERLGRALAAPEAGREEAFYPELCLLADVGRLDLLDALGRRGGGQLEDRLARFLVERIGPRQTLDAGSASRRPGLDLLLRMGGDGYCRVQRAYAGDDSQYAQLDVVQGARRAADTGLSEAVADLGSRPDPWDESGAMMVQCEAARTLAGHGDATRLLRVAAALDFLPADLGDWWQKEGEVPADAAEQAIDAVRRREPRRTCAPLVALGLIRHPPAIAEALAILDGPATRGETVAALVALGLSAAGDAAITDAIAARLGGDLDLFAVTALSRIGTVPACRALLGSLAARWNAGLAAWLAHRESASAEAVELLAGRLTTEAGTEPHPTLASAFGVVLRQTSDDVLSRVLRACGEAVTDQLRAAATSPEGTSIVVGARRDAIRGLSHLDPTTARIAAARSLRDPNAADRPLYPPLLRRLDRAASRDLFLALARDERDSRVTAAMAYALDPDDADRLLIAFDSPEPGTRASACRLSAGPCGEDSRVAAALRRALDDGSGDVADAAELALRSLGAQQRAAELVASLDGDSSLQRLAAVADAAIRVGRVGYRQGATPAWVDDLFAALRRQPALAKGTRDRVERAKRKADDTAARRLRT